MKVYYQDELITLIHGDNREWLRSLKPHKDKFDLCLTDPPYDGVGVTYGELPESGTWLRSWIENYFPILRQHCKRILLTPGILAVQKYPQVDWILSWTNAGARGMGRSKQGFCSWNPVLSYGPDAYLESQQGARPDAFICSGTRPRGLKHPTPKPLDAWRWLLERGSISKDDRICDPFSGSGTTAVVCKQSGRHCLAIEIFEEYCEETAKRLEAIEPLWSNSAQGDNTNGRRTERSTGGGGESEGDQSPQSESQNETTNKQLTFSEIAKFHEEIITEQAEEWNRTARSIGPLGKQNDQG